MNFNDHSNLEGLHALFSASKYAWLRYDEDKMLATMANSRASAEGTRKHAFAAEAISLKRKLGGSRDSLTMHVNDAIGFRMTPEVVLYYSPWFFGTADALGVDDRKKILRIQDLKTGSSKASFDQLMIYAAYFFLEYENLYRVTDLTVELYIYQNGEILEYFPTPEEIVPIMDKVKTFTKIAEEQLLD